MTDTGDTWHTTEVVLIGGIGLSSHMGFWEPDFILHVLPFVFFTFAAAGFAIAQRPFRTLAKDDGVSALPIKINRIKSQKKLCSV
jgi:hypothetical protein